MSKSMGIVFCIDYTSSMTSHFNTIRATIISICMMVLHIQGDVRIGLVKFRSTYDLWNTYVHHFTANINVFQQWLDNDEPGGICPDGYEAVGDALNDALNIGWRANAGAQIFNEKLVILVTDGAPNGLRTTIIGADPWVISNRFEEQDITLVVVGVGDGIVECDDFYCALAKNTGGQYIPMINFKRIFQYVMNLVLNEDHTIGQAFRRVHVKEIEKNSSFRYSYMEDRVNGMINECKTMNDIQKFFNHRSSQI